jgi:hypothetical protein
MPTTAGITATLAKHVHVPHAQTPLLLRVTQMKGACRGNAAARGFATRPPLHMPELLNTDSASPKKYRNRAGPAGGYVYSTAQSSSGSCSC